MNITKIFSRSAIALALVATVGAGSALAAEDIANPDAVATVNESISISFPFSSTLQFGGIPGDNADGAEVNMTVTTNNSSGYTLTGRVETAFVSPDPLVNPDTIPLTNLSLSAYPQMDSGARSEQAMDGTDKVLWANATETAEAGENLLLDGMLNIPFVVDDTYSTQVILTASTNL